MIDKPLKVLNEDWFISGNIQRIFMIVKSVHCDRSN